MIIDGVVYREGHPSWCTCDECEAEHPGKRAFFAAYERMEAEKDHDIHWRTGAPVIGCSECEAIDPGTWRARYADTHGAQ